MAVLGGQTWCFKSFWADIDTFFMLIRKMGFKMPIRACWPSCSPLVLCGTIFCGSGGNLGAEKGRKHAAILLGKNGLSTLLDPTTFKTRLVNTERMVWLSHFCNLCPQHHTSPESPNPVIFPKPSIVQGHVQSQACNYGCEWQTT